MINSKRALVIETHPYKVSYACRGHFVKSIIIKEFFKLFFIFLFFYFFILERRRGGDVTNQHN
jgi:hypothetical protein